MRNERENITSFRRKGQTMAIKAKLPMGIEDFKRIRMEEFYYIDKTGLIRELLENESYINLFTRPRRFGKSLNMSMLKYFFEIGSDNALFNLSGYNSPQLCCVTNFFRW